MARPKRPDGEPTKSELEILQVLWKNGPSSVRFINDELNKKKVVAYTSTLKIMQLMYDKGMLFRDDRAMTHIYITAVKEQPIKNAMLNRFVDTVFSGSSSALMVQLLGNKQPTREELAQLKELVKQLEINSTPL